jgi:hypothetical protein
MSQNDHISTSTPRKGSRDKKLPRVTFERHLGAAQEESDSRVGGDTILWYGTM